MTEESTILDRLPEYAATDTVLEEEPHKFSTYDDSPPTKTVYLLEKAPILRLDGVTAIINGRERELDESQYETRDTTGNGKPDSVAFIDSDAYPDSGSTFIVSYIAESILSRYVGAFDDDMGDVSGRIDNARMSKFIMTANGRSLDLLGSMFNDIGLRRGRDDEEYRTFLLSVVPTFNANGTRGDVIFAIKSALDADREDFEITEDFDNVTYSIIINSWKPHQGSTLESIAELTSPSGVELQKIGYAVDADVMESSDVVDITPTISVSDSSVSSDSATVADTGSVVWGEDWGTMQWAVEQD